MEEKEILKLALLELKKRGIIKTQKELAELVEVTPASFSLAMNGKMTARNILIRMNKIAGGIFNVAWLYTGEGEMLAPKADEQTFNVNMGSGMQVGDSNTYNAGADAEELDTLRKENIELKEENAELRKESAEKDKTIARLEGRIETYKEMLAK